jgi:4-hydroxy-tetrahydrodipicolinate reductase
MGREVCRAVHEDSELALVAGISRSAAGHRLSGAIGLEGAEEVVLSDKLDALSESGVQVAVDFTAGSFAPEHIAWCIDSGINVVVGTTGFEIDESWRGAPVGVILAPNFAIGAALMMRFAEEASRYMPEAEIVEMHHEGKRDAPSGTAKATAGRIGAARAGGFYGVDADELDARGAVIDGVRVHSVRLPGLLAHHEVIFGSAGQTLSIRHDTSDRSSFMPGVLMAIKAAPERMGLTVGLGELLGWD